MKTIYVSGAYTGTDEEVDQNIQRAAYYSIELWKMGYGVHCPHLNTAHFEKCGIPYEQFMQFDFWLLRKGFDALFLCPDWENSKGTKRELEYAQQLGVRILRTLEEAKEFVDW